MTLPPEEKEPGPLHYTPGQVPDESIWTTDLRPIRGLLRNRTRPWPFERVLDCCYVHNTPATQAHFRSLNSIHISRVMQTRYDAEKNLHTILNSLKTFHARASALHAFVTEERGELETELVKKEREALNIIREKIKETRSLLSKASGQAGTYGDRHYVEYCRPLMKLAEEHTAMADALLLKHLRYLVAYSRINGTYHKAVGAMAIEDPGGSAYVRAAEAARAAGAAQLGAMPMTRIEPLVERYTDVALMMQYYVDRDVAKLAKTMGRELLSVMEMKGVEPPGRVFVGGRALPSRRVLLDKARRLEMYWPADLSTREQPAAMGTAAVQQREQRQQARVQQ